LYLDLCFVKNCYAWPIFSISEFLSCPRSLGDNLNFTSMVSVPIFLVLNPAWRKTSHFMFIWRFEAEKCVDQFCKRNLPWAWQQKLLIRTHIAFQRNVAPFCGGLSVHSYLNPSWNLDLRDERRFEDDQFGISLPFCISNNLTFPANYPSISLVTFLNTGNQNEKQNLYRTVQRIQSLQNADDREIVYQVTFY